MYGKGARYGRYVRQIRGNVIRVPPRNIIVVSEWFRSGILRPRGNLRSRGGNLKFNIGKIRSRPTLIRFVSLLFQ